MAKRNNIRPICFVTGKSGGHIIPCLTVAKQNYPQHPILFFSTTTPLDHALLNNKVAWHVPLRFGQRSTISITLFFLLLHSCLHSLWWLIKKRPKKIISTGGLVAIPVCIAGFILRIPIELFELNASPGKAIQFLAPLANHVYVCFEQAKKYFPEKKCSVMAYPIREYAGTLSLLVARKQLGLDNKKKTILVLGGSQGSAFINSTVRDWLAKEDLHKTVQIIHQVGAHDVVALQKFYFEHNYQAQIFSFSDSMIAHYTAADLVMCRAGAGTLFEIIHFNKPCITIPLQVSTTGHQKDNALALSKSYANLIVLDQNNCTFETIRKSVYQLLAVK